MAYAITTQTQAIMIEDNEEVVPRENQHSITMATRLRDFTQINPHMLFGFKLDKDHQYFLDEIYQIFFAMGVSTTKRADLAIYQLNDATQTWYNQLKDNCALRGGLVTWYIFKKAFIDRFFPRDQT